MTGGADGKPSARDTLAQNIKRLIGDQSTRAWALGKGLDVKQVERLAKGSHAVTLDSLERVANACDLSAWQLLVPNLDPGRPPDCSHPDAQSDSALIAQLRGLLAAPGRKGEAA